MKRFIIILMAVSVTLFSCAGWKSVPDKMEALVSKVEEGFDNYTPEDWDGIQAEYYDLMKAYRKDKAKYTTEERSRIIKAAGRYQGLLIRQGLTDAVSLINDIPVFLDGIGRVINDPEENSIEAIEESVDSLIEYVGDEVSGFLDRLEDIFE